VCVVVLETQDPSAEWGHESKRSIRPCPQEVYPCEGFDWGDVFRFVVELWRVAFAFGARNLDFHFVRRAACLVVDFGDFSWSLDACELAV
jgi:hypothetical protein